LKTHMTITTNAHEVSRPSLLDAHKIPPDPFV
jgi:hypothetical protein